MLHLTETVWTMKLLFLLSLILAMQIQRQQLSRFEDAVLLLCGAGTLEELSEDEWERYRHLADHPLDLNACTRSAMLSSGLFSPFQAASLLDRRMRDGDILSYTELGYTDGFTPELARALSHFVVLRSRNPPGKPSVPQLHASLLLRTSCSGSSSVPAARAALQTAAAHSTSGANSTASGKNPSAATSSSAILSILMATGVLSHPARQLASALDIQQRNTYAAVDAQMDELTAHGVAMSEKLGRELDAFLAAKGIPFDALNDDPKTIAELETRLYTPLSTTLSAASCSGIFFCLNVTANTALPNADALRAGLYLRYSGLQPTVASEQDVICFRGAAEAARGLQLQMHNRWNPELNTALIPGSNKVATSQVERLAEGSLWAKRTELLDTWEHVMLLCVPILDGSGTVRGFCGMEISDLYFSLSHDTVSSSYGNMLTLLAPIDGDKLNLSGTMLGATNGSRLTAEGTLHIKPGKYYTIYTDGKESYLGRHRLLDAATSDGIPLAAVTLVTANTFRSYERGSQFAWFLGSVLFLLAMLVAATVLSRRFVKPINESLAAVRGDTTEVVTSGISEIDELLTMIRERPVGALPPDVEARLCGFAERANTLTGTERTILQYYMDGYTVKDIPELAHISASTVKTHNRNLYRKMGVDSFDELKVYIELFASCGRSGELLKR